MKLSILTLILFCYNLVFSQGFEIGFNIHNKIQTGEDVIKKMYERYKLAPCKSYTFSQKNTHYRNDSIIGTSEWHEAIEFPDKFRIDFGDTTKGNFVIFRNDSAYNYRNFTLKKTSYNSQTLLLLLGGMYYRELADIIKRLNKDDYNLTVLSSQKINKQNYYVIGAKEGNLNSNQIWVNKKTLRIERIIEKINEKDTMDMSFDSYQANCKGFIETKVTFKRNGKVEQVEEYYNIKTVDVFPNNVFYP